MFGVSRRLFATIAAAATILVLTTSVVAAADPDSLTAARANRSLGALSHQAPKDARPAALELHGGGLTAPATDIEVGPLAIPAPASGSGLPLATWAVVFVIGALASLRYMARRSRL